MALTQLKTGAIADDAVTTAKLAAGTDGQIITYDASGNPTAVGPGTDGQVLTSTGAGSPPAFETPAPGVGGASGVDFNDSIKVRLGTGNDLEIYHDGTESFIHNNTDDLNIEGDSIKLRSHSGEAYIVCTGDGATEVRHDNEKVLETGAAKVNFKQRIQIHNDGPGSGHGMSIGQWDGSNHRIEGDANRPIVITSYNSGGIKMGVSGANKVAINSYGIVFNGDTAAANALDDYEEGTWTPYFHCTNSSQTVAYSNTAHHGHYTKIGNLVFVTFRMYWTSKSGTGPFSVGNLPFTSANDTNISQPSGFTSHYFSGMGSNNITGYLLSNDTMVRIGYHTNGGFSEQSFQNLSGSGEYNGHITYRVS